MSLSTVITLPQSPSSVGFDTLGRPNAVTNALGAFGYSYDGATGRLDHVDYPNGQKTQLSYFGGTGARRLQQIKHTDATAAMISQFDYTYNAGGNLQTWTQNHSGLTNPRRQTFGYDAIDELTAATLKDTVTSATVSEQAYRYDAAGNRTTVQNGNMVATETPNGLNQLTQVAGGGMMRFAGALNKPASVKVGGNPATVRGDNSFEGQARVAASGTTRVPIVATDIDNNVTNKYVDVTPDAVGNKSLTYDLNGNTLTAGPSGSPETTYEWDAADRLIAINHTGTNTRTEFGYDGLGRRVKIVEKSSGGPVTETRQFIWDGLTIAEQRSASNAVVRSYFADGYRDVVGSASYYCVSYNRVTLWPKFSLGKTGENDSGAPAHAT